jgi:signal transduction histidine kinase
MTHPTLHDTAPPSPPAEDAAALERRVRALEGLCALAVDAAGSVDPEGVFAVVCERVAGVLEADFVSVELPLFGGVRDWCGGAAPAREVTVAFRALMERVRRTGERVAAGEAEGAAEELPVDDVVPAAWGAASAVVVPMEADGGGRGALLVGWHRRGPLTPQAVKLACDAGPVAAAAFRNAERYDALRQAAVRRDRFFSAMSHDLRTPITAIMGYSELLQDGIMGELDERQLEMIDRICQVSGHLSQLVNDILDLAKLDAGRMELHREQVVLGELVDEAVVAVEPQARSKGLELELEAGLHRGAVLHVDGSRVRQILVNLLSNAVKFTERGRVSVAAGVEGPHGWIEVRDTGPGIPGGSEEAVFEEFLQIAAGNKAKREPGSGLGLAIARRLARAMGGDLTARNGEQGGAVFTLFLPVGDEDGSSGG